MAFQMMAVFILLAFYGCYFLKMISQRRKGIKTDQLGKGKIGFTKVIEITMKIATYIVVLAEVVSIVMNETVLAAPVRGIGACIAVIGVGVFILSVVTMQDSWRAGVSNTDRTELVTKGIYQISRNPAFLGFDLVYIGMICMFFNWPLLFVSIWAMVMFHLQIKKVEEVFLLETFGEAYLNYRNKVCRYFGRKGKYGRKNKNFFRQIINAVVLSGVILIIIGSYYCIVKAGIPYQDPPLELQIQYTVNMRIGETLLQNGMFMVICGGVIRLVLVWTSKKHRT